MDTKQLVRDYGCDMDAAGCRGYFLDIEAEPRAPRSPRALREGLTIARHGDAPYGRFAVTGSRGEPVLDRHGEPRFTGGGELRDFSAWWQARIRRSPGSDKAKVTPEMGWRLWRLERSTGVAVRLPVWTNIKVRSMRELDAHLRIERKLGRRCVDSRTSRSGLTATAPQWLVEAGGRDMVRLSRLSTGFLRWLAAVVDRAPKSCLTIWVGSGYRIDWAAMAAYTREYAELAPFIPVLREYRVPMWAWREQHARHLVGAPLERRPAIAAAMKNAGELGADLVLGRSPRDVWPELTAQERKMALATEDPFFPPRHALTVLSDGALGPSGCERVDRWMLACLRDVSRRPALLAARWDMYLVGGDDIPSMRAGVKGVLARGRARVDALAAVPFTGLPGCDVFEEVFLA